MPGKRDRTHDGRDTSPLDLKQLSDAEFRIILEIEQRLREAAEHPLSDQDNSQESYLASVQTRYPRVLLLDGGRGTGKTAILLTLVKRWHGAAGIQEEKVLPDADDKKRANMLRAMDDRIPEGGIAPTYVRVVRILDFDPLPPEMPLVAGIIEAWRPLAKRYDPPAVAGDHACDDDDEFLMESWHRLFRVAAVGWTDIPKQSGLIEQVLDREEQVEDWQHLAEHWRQFIWDVIARGRRLKGADKLSADAVFVIMIDDVDLQVGRVRELLPALRLLYHPRVFFLVAAHQAHMIDMLKLDFLGQQSKLARHANAQDFAALDLADADRWASELATSAFEKVFPRMNHWKLQRLSLKEFLAFPGQIGSLPPLTSDLAPLPRADDSAPQGKESAAERAGRNFFDILNEMQAEIQDERRGEQAQPEQPGEGRPPEMATKQTQAVPHHKRAGELILRFAHRADEAKLPGVMTYRAVHQLRAYVMRVRRPRPVEVLARLLSGSTDEQAAVVRDGAAEVQRDSTTRIDVFITGELAALYRPGPVEFAGDYNVVLSARPDFVFVLGSDRPPTRMSTDSSKRFNFTAAMVAKIMQDEGFAVDATSLRWETYLSLAWTEWFSPRLAFAWTRHRHPRPDALLDQTQDWGEFIKSLGEPRNKLERYAYAWVYFQRKWSACPAAEALNPTKLQKGGEPLPWDDLLHFEEPATVTGREELKRWRYSTLPLLARPELGFPPEVQERLLGDTLKEGVEAGVKEELRRERRRRVTDAYVAAEAQQGRTVQKLPEDKAIGEFIKTIDALYAKAHPTPSPWSEIERNGEEMSQKLNGPDKERG